jgi:hypothetical protein
VYNVKRYERMLSADAMRLGKPALRRTFTVHSSETRLAPTVGGPATARSQMKTPMLIVLTVLMLGIGGALAAMNNACKSNHHSWCAPNLSVRHHVKVEHS